MQINTRKCMKMQLFGLLCFLATLYSMYLAANKLMYMHSIFTGAHINFNDALELAKFYLN